MSEDDKVTRTYMLEVTASEDIQEKLRKGHVEEVFDLEDDDDIRAFTEEHERIL